MAATGPGRGRQGSAGRHATLDLWVALGLVLTLALGATLSGAWRTDGPAPDFALVSTGYENGTMGEPQAFRLSQYHGRTVVLDFMAVACTTCRTVTEDVLKPLARAHPDVVVLSIDTWSDPGSGNMVGETDRDIVQLQRQTGVWWRHARDTDGVYVDYAAVILPKIAVVDPDGTLVYSDTGSQDAARLEAAVVAAQARTAGPIPALRVGLYGFAFVAGLACVFTPCGVGLLPAYIGLLVERGGAAGPARRVARALGGGVQAAFGIVAVYAVLALLFLAFGPALRPLLPWLAPVLGLGLAVLGVLALRGTGWAFLPPRGTVFASSAGARAGAVSGFAAFGAAYGLAGFACTGPLFLPILLLGFAAGPGYGLAALGLYTLAVAGVVLAVAALVALGEQTRAGALVAGAPWVHKASAAILAVGGLAVAWYGAHAYGLL
ncbi:MAG TPA: cytochrome c biogenesis protein CcdA [Candidatus Thermoplasmatota archaeon]|nr:cytochrome c biogenesis protein CcdA [Candidatus Thermoplasmatota archaeon]